MSNDGTAHPDWIFGQQWTPNELRAFAHANEYNDRHKTNMGRELTPNEWQEAVRSFLRVEAETNAPQT